MYKTCKSLSKYLKMFKNITIYLKNNSKLAQNNCISKSMKIKGRAMVLRFPLSISVTDPIIVKS